MSQLGPLMPANGEFHFAVTRVTSPSNRLRAARFVRRAAVCIGTNATPAKVAAMLHGLITMPKGSRVVGVISGGNVNLDQLRGLKWN